jgi:hypothetical protein
VVFNGLPDGSLLFVAQSRFRGAALSCRRQPSAAQRGGTEPAPQAPRAPRFDPLGVPALDAGVTARVFVTHGRRLTVRRKHGIP